jgi:hypothetical protein
MDIIDLISDPLLLGPYFQGSSWDRWRAVLRAAFALPMTKRDRVLFAEVAGDRAPPKKPVRELVVVGGRGSGKDAIATALATLIPVVGDFSRLRPGEKAIILLLASDRDQAGIAFDYLKGYFENVPLLAAMVKGRIKEDVIDLKNGSRILVGTNNFRAPRGRTIAAAIYDECSVWRSDDSVTPDYETDSAVSPGLSRWPGSLKIMISSAYRRTGLFYERWKSTFGKDDADCLSVLGTSLQFNPTLDEKIIQRELDKDYPRASAEYLSVWRDDLSTYISRQLVEELIDRGCREREYDRSIRTYRAFTDEAGGSGQDASTLSIVHVERDGLIVQDVMRIWKPPFNSQAVFSEKARILKSFRLGRVVGDKWAGGLPPALYRAEGIAFEQNARPRSELYLDFLHLLNARRIRMLDEPTQISQLCSLERKTDWGGRESIGHAANAHDDACNSLAGSAVLAATKKPSIGSMITAETLARFNRPSPGQMKCFF